MYTHTYKHQPHIRQEGFSVDPTHPSANDYSTDPMDFGSMTRMDFTDELASLMGAASPPHPSQQHQSNERSTQSPDPASYKTHNIFDMSANTAPPPPPSSAASTTTTTTTNFNSTVPALNSSMRFEPHGSNDAWRHTPSPIEGRSESRSRSRPPAGAGGPTSNSSTNSNGTVGPTRTTRTRRGSSAAGEYGRPNAIVIPGTRNHGHGLSSPLSSSAATTSGSWLGPASPASEFTLPTPDSLHHHHSLHSLHNHHHSHNQNHSQFYGNGHGAYGSYNSNTGSNAYFGGGAGGGGNNGTSMSPQTEYHLTTPSTSLPVQGNLHQHIGGGGGGGHGHHRSTSASNAPVQPPPPPSSAGAPGGGATPTLAQNMSPAEKQALAASEKRRRRRESHNAVERRRRDNINEKISELATLIPEDMLEGGVPSVNGAPQPIAPSTSGDSPTSPICDNLMSPLDDSVSSMWGDLTVTTKKEDSNSMFGEDILSTSIPAAASPTSGNGGANSASAGVVKANKGMILRKSVEYIRYLQHIVQTQNARNRQLEQELAQYRPPSSGSQNNNNGSSSSSSQEGGSFTTAPSASWTGIEGAGYAGSYRILDSMPEETTTTTTTNTNEVKGMVSPVSQPASGSTPSSVDDDDDGDSDYEESAAGSGGRKKGSVVRGRRTSTRRRKVTSKGVGEDVDMGSAEEGVGMVE